MKVTKTTTILVTISLFAALAVAQRGESGTGLTADDVALRAADDSFERAYHSGDLETVVALYAEDAVLLPEGAPAVKGRKAIREYFATAIAAAKTAGESNPGTFSERTTGASGDLGWSSGKNTIRGPGGAITWRGKFLSVSRKVDGKWLYIRDTWNSDTPAEAH